MYVGSSDNPTKFITTTIKQSHNKHNIPAPSGAPPPVGAQSRPHSSRSGDHYSLKPPGYSASGDYTELAVSLEKANNDRKSIEMEHAALKDRLEIEIEKRSKKNERRV